MNNFGAVKRLKISRITKAESKKQTTFTTYFDVLQYKEEHARVYTI